MALLVEGPWWDASCGFSLGWKAVLVKELTGVHERTPDALCNPTREKYMFSGFPSSRVATGTDGGESHHQTPCSNW